MEYIQQAMELKVELDKLRPISAEDEARIMQKFRLDWDYHSNHLEGNSLTYGETKALIMFGITAQGKPLKDHFEITGHDEAIKWVIEVVKGEYPLTETFIRELHVLLLKEPYERPAITADGKETTKRIEVGKYKTHPNHVLTKTGEIFRFATPEETPAQMHDLIDWYREKKDNSDTNPILLAAEFHYKFIRIHPFDDGNGRIARILMNFILMQFSYPPLIIKTEDKANYFSALQQADSGIIEPFIEYIGQNVVRSLEIMISGAKGESIEDPDDLDKELALLELKLKGTGKKISFTQSKEAILNVYENSFLPLATKAIEKLLKFDRFYLEKDIHFWINSTVILKDESDPFLKIRQEITDHTDKIGLSYAYNGLRHVDFENVDYGYKIVFDFYSSSYIIEINNEKKIENVYDKQLTESEINEIVTTETIDHKKFIQEKIEST